MALPYKIATLLYCFNERDEVLLLERAHEPNRGFWSPCGGKLKTDMGESPYACACREAREEIGAELRPQDLHLTGLISEHGYQDQTHWLMFLFEVKLKLKALPPPHQEGRFEFFSRTAIDVLKIPQTDREQIWPWFWQYRGGFFAAIAIVILMAGMIGHWKNLPNDALGIRHPTPDFIRHSAAGI